jgi:hypothetical protein
MTVKSIAVLYFDNRRENAAQAPRAEARPVTLRGDKIAHFGPHARGSFILRGRKKEHVSTGWRGYFDVRTEHRMKAEAFVRMIRHAAQS